MRTILSFPSRARTAAVSRTDSSLTLQVRHQLAVTSTSTVLPLATSVPIASGSNACHSDGGVLRSPALDGVIEAIAMAPHASRAVVAPDHRLVRRLAALLTTARTASMAISTI